uniref:Uncharacterized protein n=1 Tax=Anguilla anguilla TaxID=7936 RepID=A0A0E9QDE7_ANGAN
MEVETEVDFSLKKRKKTEFFTKYVLPFVMI